MYDLVIVGVILFASLGFLLYFIGWANSIFMTLGKDQKVKAIAIFILNPLGIYYCLEDWDNYSKQGLQMIIGLFIMSVTILPSYFYIQSLK